MRVVKIRIRGHGAETDAPSAEDLIEQFRDYLDMLKGVETALAEDGQNAIDWRVVNAGKSSPLQIELGAYPRQYAVNIDRRTQAVVQRTAEGLTTLRDRAERPPFFTDAVLTRARRIFERVTNGLDLSEVDFGPEIPTFVVTPLMAQLSANNVRAVMTPGDKPYREIGSIEGVTEGVERDGHGRRILYVKHRLTGDTIKCFLFGNALEDIQDHRIAEVYRSRRLRVFGTIHYRSLGRITQVDVTEAEFGRPRAELPSVDDILDQNFTGGLRSEDYLEALRDGRLS
jgi:hypothetical protein